MRRMISLWLPTLASDRFHRRRTRRSAARAEALVTVEASQGTERVACPSAGAQAAGIVPGMTLADARALLPDLCARPAEPVADARTLAGLADWCGRYTPWAAPDASGGGRDHGLFLDVSGCAHLFGGETMLIGDLLARLRGLGFACRAALADTPGAAWAVARFGGAMAGTGAETGAVVPPGEQRAALADLPVRALRLPTPAAEGLAGVGLRRIGDLYPIARGGLVRRFGEDVTRRLDQALGRAREPISPRRPVARWRERLAFPEPIGHADDIAAATRHLLARLCSRLERGHRGARRLDLALYRADGTVSRAEIGTSRPAREPAHLFGLLVEHFDKLDVGLGVEVMVLAAPLTDPLSALQLTLASPRATTGDPDPGGLDQLVDRLGNRLGRANVVRFAARESHLPERAAVAVPPLAPLEDEVPWPLTLARPPRLLRRPEPVDAVAEVPDGPPVLFRWRRVVHRVALAEGPERIAPEWWRGEMAQEAATRDYFRIEDVDGRRFWLYRGGLYRPQTRAPAPEPRWYLHGIFA